MWRFMNQDKTFNCRESLTPSSGYGLWPPSPAAEVRPLHSVVSQRFIIIRFIFSSFIYLSLSISELLRIWMTPHINSDPVIHGPGLYREGRWSAMFKGNVNWKSSLLTLLGITTPVETLASAKTCLSGSAERLSKLPSHLAAPCQPEMIKCLLITALSCYKSLSARHRPASSLNEIASRSEPLTLCFQNHFSFNQACQRR